MHHYLMMTRSKGYKASFLLMVGIQVTPKPENNQEAPRMTEPQNKITALEHMNANPSLHASPGILVEKKENKPSTVLKEASRVSCACLNTSR